MDAEESRARIWQQIHGILSPGYQVASGTSPTSPFSAGTIALQKPVFKSLGLDLDEVYNGTLNISIAPHEFAIVNPDHIFTNVRWTDAHHPEDFSFVACKIVYNERAYAGWIYHPHPETKSMHFQRTSVLEVLTPPVEDIEYGAQLTLQFEPTKMRIEKGQVKN